MTKNWKTTDMYSTQKFDDGATIHFKFEECLTAEDRELVANFRKTFKKARYDGDAKTWFVSGVRAYNRIVKWAEAAFEARAEAEAKKEQQHRDAEFEGRLHEVDVVEALKHRASEFKSSQIKITHKTVAYKVAGLFSEQVREIARAADAKFDKVLKSWIFTAKTMEDVDSMIQACNHIYEIRLAMIETEKQEREEREIKRRARWEKMHRYIVIAQDAPDVGTTTRYRGELITITGYGKPWRADDDLSSMGGPVGCEGNLVRYAYYRDATADEVADFQGKEAAKAAESARRNAVAKVAAGEAGPHLGEEPEGEVIWQDESNALVGYTTKIILTADNWLWHVTYDGTDGAAWGDYNCGYNTHGVRVPATTELIETIRGR